MDLPGGLAFIINNYIFIYVFLSPENKNDCIFYFTLYLHNWSPAAVLKLHISAWDCDVSN